MHFSPQNFCRQVLKLAGKSYASAAKVSNDLKIVVLTIATSVSSTMASSSGFFNRPVAVFLSRAILVWSGLVYARATVTVGPVSCLTVRSELISLILLLENYMGLIN